MYKELESHRQNCQQNTKMFFFSKSKGDLGHTDLVQHKINKAITQTLTIW